MMIPTIHINGTGRADLLLQYQQAIAALALAQKALQSACPNGRDYYPQGDRAIIQALDEHHERLAKLSDVMTELREIAMQIPA
jgi:hypothetical protein